MEKQIEVLSSGVTSLKEFSTNEFNVYPNPTDGNFSVNLGDVYENSEVLITDLSGKLIDSKTMTQSQTLNLSIEEPAGIYIVSIQAGDKKAVIRLIKE